MAEKTLEMTFLDNFKADEPIGLAGKGVDLLVHSFMNGNIMREIPVAGTLISLLKIGKNVIDYRFQKKILKFLTETESIPSDKRIEFVIELEDYIGEEAGGFLLDYLESLDNVNKAGIVGKLLRAKIEGHITLDDYLRLCNVVSRVFYYDLVQLSKYASLDAIEPIYKANIAQALYNDGLIRKRESIPDQEFYEANADSEKKRFLFATSFGVLLIKHGLAF